MQVLRRNLGGARPLVEPASRSTPELTQRLLVNVPHDLFFLIALPKSAGQALRNMLNACRNAGPLNYSIPPSLFCPNGLHVELPLTDAALHDFPNGGWHHTHAPATLMTLDFLYRRRIRHIVQVRHPLDQLVAYYCHIMKHARQGVMPVLPWQPTLAQTHPQSAVPAAAFDERTSPDDAFELLIHHGYLEAVLTWIGQWEMFRDPELSLLVQYEELIVDPMRLLHRACEFLHPLLQEPAEGFEHAVQELDDYSTTSRYQGQQLSASPYPKGYTGRAAVHLDYFSPRNLESARAICRRFLLQSPYAEGVRKIYPDL